MALTQVFPQNLLLSFPVEPPQTFIGMPWFDSANAVFKFDSTGSGDFVAALPQHTTTGEHGPQVTIDQTSADSALIVLKSNVSTGVAFQLTNAGTGTGFNLTQNGSGQALGITQNADQIALSVVKVAGGTGETAFFEQQSGTGNVLRLTQSGSGTALRIINSGVGNGITISQDGEGIGLNVNKTSTGSKIALEVKNSGTGYGFFMEQIGDAPAIKVEQTTAATTNVIEVTNSGTGIGIEVTQAGANTAMTLIQDGAATGLFVTKTNASNNPAVQINNSGSGGVLVVDDDGTGTALNINKDNALGPSLNINHLSTDSTAEAVIIINNAMDNAIRIQQSTNFPVIDIVNNSGDPTARDLQNSSDSWYIDKSGNATFNTVTQTGGSNLKMFEVVIAPSASGARFQNINGKTSWSNLSGMSTTQSFSGGVVECSCSIQAESTIYSGAGAGWVKMRMTIDGNAIAGSYDAIQMEPTYTWQSSWGALQATTHINVAAGNHQFKLQYRTEHNGAGNPLAISRREMRMKECDYAIGLSSIQNFS